MLETSNLEFLLDFTVFKSFKQFFSEIYKQKLVS